MDVYTFYLWANEFIIGFHLFITSSNEAKNCKLNLVLIFFFPEIKRYYVERAI